MVQRLRKFFVGRFTMSKCICALSHINTHFKSKPRNIQAKTPNFVSALAF